MDHVREKICISGCTNGCVVCNLFICAVCGGAEGDLTTHCPGEKVSSEVLNKVYAGKADYKDGKWHYYREGRR